MDKELDGLFSKSALYYKNRIIGSNPTFNINKPVILFGAAKMGKIYLEMCAILHIKVIAFCDNNKKISNTYSHNTLVIDPNTLQSTFDHNIQIIITSLYESEIKDQLFQLGFRNVWSHTYFSTLFSKKINILGWTNNINSIIDNKNNIVKCFNLLEDDDSKKTLVQIVKYRLTLDSSCFHPISLDLKRAYFDNAVIKLADNEVFLDGGAYDGDTVKPFIKKTKRMFEKIVCFEPDCQSYSLLRSYVTNKLKDSRIELVQRGLGDKVGTVHFTNEGNLQSQVSYEGAATIKITTIDHYFKNKFTYIKLDIEGYEKEALKGANKTIASYKPKLAVCIYHYVKDLWEVPLIIKKLNPKYKLFIRHYNTSLFDTVCYAI